jgi:hypothetical protein
MIHMRHISAQRVDLEKQLIRKMAPPLVTLVSSAPEVRLPLSFQCITDKPSILRSNGLLSATSTSSSKSEMTSFKMK